MKQYFNIGGGAHGDGGGDSKRGLSHIVAVPVSQVYVLPTGEGGVTLSQGAKHTENTQQALDQKEKMKALIMHKILKLQQDVEADAKPRSHTNTSLSLFLSLSRARSLSLSAIRIMFPAFCNNTLLRRDT